MKEKKIRLYIFSITDGYEIIEAWLKRKQAELNGAHPKWKRK